ncbi:MAG: exo-beta-N-acetylmuramidase NamZ family protein [Bacteroidota bacterium]
MKTFRRCFVSMFIIVSACIAAAQTVTTGAERLTEYLPHLNGKRIGIVANQTTIIGRTHLVDSLLALDVNIVKIFVPEHGFRGDEDAGAIISNEKDPSAGIPIISLYRSDTRTEQNKPTPEDLSGLDLLIFDFQDVGTRFYTNNSAMHYIMEACAENNLELMILDRPNPHGFYLDGPMLDTAFRSFVGMHPVPVVHGMTMGEYARMINGERWLKNGVQCPLIVIPCGNYTHDSLYALPVKPSPNLPDMQSIYLYPSICFFEGTVLSLGRGTAYPFQMFGHPSLKGLNFSFTPRAIRGAMNPPLRDQECFGVDLRTFDVKKIIASQRINLEWLIEAYRMFAQKESFFLPYINTLAGSTSLRDQIIAGMTAEEIRRTWKKDLDVFQAIRKKYLLYPDFHYYDHSTTGKER